MPVTESTPEGEINRDAQKVITEEQSPHTATLPFRTTAGAALERAIGADVRNRIAHVKLTGPLENVRCKTSGKLSAGRQPYNCTVRAAETPYTFLAVADANTQALTWCERTLPPSTESPDYTQVSARCLH